MKSYSQNGEDLIVLDIIRLNNLMRTFFKGNFVELGAGDGVHFSNCQLFRELGWNGVSIDSDNKGNKLVKEAFITCENISQLILDGISSITPIPLIHFLSIDLDGNDFWVLARILKFWRPMVICCEVNSQLPLDSSIAINYNPKRVWDGSFAYGMSYLAAIKLLKYFGYKVIRCVNNTNLIAVHIPSESQFDTLPIEQFGSTWSHPETMPEGSHWVEITDNLIKSL